MNNTWVRIQVVCILSLMLILSVSRIPLKESVQYGAQVKDFSTYLDRRIPELMKAYDIPGACIAVISQGRTAWMKAYGYADLKAGRKMTTGDYLRVQSISKPVTAWGVMKLVEKGTIDLDGKVIQYIRNWKFPVSPFPPESITVRQLLSHCSGLPLGDILNRYDPNDEIPPLQESIAKEAVLLCEPGTGFSYSNTGYNVLELLIEEVTGRNFSEYMEHEVLLPLGMKHSTFTWTQKLQPPVPFGYDLKGKAVPVYVYPEKGSGGLFATVGDIASFVSAGMPRFADNYPVLHSESIQMLYTPMARGLGVYDIVFDAYGLGYYIENLADGSYAVSHGGQGTGWMTHFHCVPKTGDGIVILTNSQRSWPFIAYLLHDWAKWRGFGPLGMGRIIWGEYAMWAVIGLICSIVLYQMWRLGEGFITGTRCFDPLSQEKRPLRLGLGSLSVALAAGLGWCMNQEYLFISSVFPIAAVWLGIAVFALAFVFMLTALLPQKPIGKFNAMKFTIPGVD